VAARLDTQVDLRAGGYPSKFHCRPATKRPRCVRGLEKFERIRFSRSFFMRDFLCSDIAAIQGLQNIPKNPDFRDSRPCSL
jgi:hypothetical protein